MLEERAFYRGANPVKCRTITIKQAVMTETASCVKMRFGGISFRSMAWREE
jgi:hypothetical protein